MKKIVFLSLIMFVAMAFSVFSAELYVPGQHPTIQAAIDAANDGDIVIVADGIYTGEGNKNLSWDANIKQITVKSENGPENCIIDCENSGRGFSFNTSLDDRDIIMGFTIRNGNADKGGGIYCRYSSPTITNCTFIGNKAQYGGGIFSHDSSLLIANCTFIGNEADYHGGGICCWGSFQTITNCTITGNTGIWGGGVCRVFGGELTIANSILWNNSAHVGPELCLLHYSSLTINYSDIEKGETAVEVTSESTLNWGSGNLNSDPLFVNVIPGAPADYRLQPNSPCINTGDPDYVAEPDETDLDGNLRVIGGRIDMGAYESGTSSDTGDTTYIQFSEYTFVDEWCANYEVIESAGPAIVTVKRTGNTDSTVTVDYYTTNYEAMAGVDYIATTGTLIFNPGEMVKTIEIPIINDSEKEPYYGYEFFGVLLRNPTGGAIIKRPPNMDAAVKIFDDDCKIHFSSSDYPIDENAGTATIEVIYTGGNCGSGEVTVNYATSDGTAIAGVDYTAISGTLTFAGSQLSVQNLTIPIINDTAVEGEKTVNLKLTWNSGDYYILSLPPTTAVLRIIDDEAAFINSGVDVPGVYGSITWGDYDNDGDLDLAVGGVGYSVDQRGHQVQEDVTRIYRNNGNNTFTDIHAEIIGVNYGCVVWGDYDNDGDLDLAISSYDSASGKIISKIYKNSGSDTFTDIGAILLEADIATSWACSSYIAWGDYGNDGNLDLAISANDYTNGLSITKIYRNNGNGTFSSVGLLPLGGTTLAWGDYNNDNNIDLAISGIDANGEVSTRIYRNNGGADILFTDMGEITEISGYIDWGDYDNDGNLDLAVSGWENDYSNPTTKIYRNNGDGTFSGMSIVGPEVGGPVAWGDYDNDGLLDLAVSGYGYDDTGEYYLTNIYRNNGSAPVTFTDIEAGLPDGYSFIAWGDYNNDGKLDLAISTYRLIPESPWLLPITKIYVSKEEAASYLEFSEYTSADGNNVAYEVSEDVGEATITVKRTGNTDCTVTVDYATRNSDARAGEDYIATSGTLTFAPGETKKTFAVPIIDDAEHEDWGEALVLTLSNPTGGAVLNEPYMAWLGILDNDCKIHFSSSDYPVNENAGEDSITVIYTGGTCGSGEITVNYATSDGSAVAGVDYTAISGTLTFAGGVPSVQQITIPIIDNAVVEGEKTINIKLTYNSGDYYSLSLPPTTAVVRIIDDEAAFMNSGVDVPGVFGSIVWGDYNNDGYLDLAVSGVSYSVDRYGRWEQEYVTRIYRNNGDNTFTDIDAEIIGADYGFLAWGDYDNDGDLDLALGGYDSASGKIISKIYKNIGSDTFTDIEANLLEIDNAEVWASSYIAWGDYNNDGLLDLAVSASDGSGLFITKIYRNNGDDTFTDIEADLLEVGGTIAWGDYNNDGKLDLAVIGSDSNYNPITRIYRNNGDDTFTDIEAGLPAGGWFSAWGDYNNDGKLDLAVSGYDSAGNPVTEVYKNNGNGTFTAIPVGLSPIGGLVAWGDYDNDGMLDLAVSGYDVDGNFAARIYRNNGNGLVTFTDIGAGLPDAYSYLAWGDYNNDGQLDLAVSGLILIPESPWVLTITKIYMVNDPETDPSEPINPNTAPSAPTSLTYEQSSSALKWNSGSDAETPASGLYYNLRVGTTPGEDSIVSSIYGSPLLGNYLRPKLSDNQLGARLNMLPPGTYYFSVQTIDTGLKASEWSIEKSFVKVNHPPVLDPIGSKTVKKGQLLQFTLTASDPDGDALTYYTGGLPAGATLNASTGLFSWTPNQAGVSFMVFIVVDTHGAADAEYVRITVIN